MDLFLTSDEYRDFSIIRKVIYYEKMVIDNRNVLKIIVNEPLIGQNYGLGAYDPDVFYLINRHDEDAFDKLNVFPIAVHVLIIKSYTKLAPSSLDDLQHIAWACLYDNEARAYEDQVKWA
jgi:hypothetical protein